MYTLLILAATFSYRSVQNTYRGVWFVNYHKVSARWGNGPYSQKNILINAHGAKLYWGCWLKHSCGRVFSTTCTHFLQVVLYKYQKNSGKIQLYVKEKLSSKSTVFVSCPSLLLMPWDPPFCGGTFPRCS